MKSMSWVLYEDDYIPHECISCGFITRSPSIYRRHTRHCPELSSHVTGEEKALLLTVLPDVLPNRGSDLTNLSHGAGSDDNRSDSERCCDAGSTACDGVVSSLQKTCEELVDTSKVCSSAPVDLLSVTAAYNCKVIEVGKRVTAHIITAEHSVPELVNHKVEGFMSSADSKDKLLKNSAVKCVEKIRLEAVSLTENSADCTEINKCDVNNKGDHETVYERVSGLNENVESRDEHSVSCDTQVVNRITGKKANLGNVSGQSNRKKLKVRSGLNKVYVCSQCDFSTTVKIERRIHMRTVHGMLRRIYRCEDCNYQSVENKNLQRHMERHLLAGPHRCSLCSYSSTSQSAVRKHTVVDHCQSVAVPPATDALPRNEQKADLKKTQPQPNEKSAKLALSVGVETKCGSIVGALQQEDKLVVSNNRVPYLKSCESVESVEVISEPLGEDEHAVKGKSSTNFRDSTDAHKWTVEVKLVPGSSDNAAELWTCLTCGMSYDKRAKVRRHVKTKHRVSMSLCRLVDRRLSVSDSRDVISNSKEEDRTRLASNNSVGLQKLPALELQGPSFELRKAKKTKILSTGSKRENVEDSFENCEDADSKSVANSRFDKSSPKKVKLTSKHQLPLLQCISTLDKSKQKLQKFRLKSLNREEAVESVYSKASPKKLKKLLVQREITSSYKASVDKKKPAIMGNSSVKTTTAGLDQVPSFSCPPVSLTDEQAAVVKSPCSFEGSPQKSEGLSTLPKKLKQTPKPSRLQSTVLESRSPQHSQRPHFSQLVQSLKNEESGSPVKVRKYAVHAGTLAMQCDEGSNISQVTDRDQDSSVKLLKISSMTSSVLLPREKKLFVKPQRSASSVKPNTCAWKYVKQTNGKSQNPPQTSLSTNSQAVRSDFQQPSAASKQLKCAHCSYSSDRLSVLRRHLLSHVAEKRYMCKLCSRQYKHEWSLILHMRHAHRKACNLWPDESSRQTNVESSKTFIDGASSLRAGKKRAKTERLTELMPKLKKIRRSGLCSHKALQINMDKISVGVHRDSNALCRVSSALKKQLTKDSKPIAEDLLDLTANKADQNSADQALSITSVGSVESHTCKYCGYIGKLPSHVKQHMKIHVGHRKYYCQLETCQYGTNWMCDMKKHVRRYHSDYSLQNNGQFNDVPSKPSIGKGKKIKRVKVSTDSSAVHVCNLEDRSGAPVLSSGLEKFDKFSVHRKKLSDSQASNSNDCEVTLVKPGSAGDGIQKSVDSKKEGGKFIQGLNSRKLPPAERYRPYKCSACGKRSNWRWDIMKHVRMTHPTNPDAYVVVLSADVARTTLVDMFRRTAIRKVRDDSAVTKLQKVSCSGKNDSADETSITENQKPLNKANDAGSAQSADMVDTLRLKRFRCSGCPYLTNHRRDVERHIRIQHEGGKCRIEILNADVASDTLMSHTLTWNRKKARILAEGSAKDDSFAGKTDGSAADGIRRTSSEVKEGNGIDSLTTCCSRTETAAVQNMADVCQHANIVLKPPTSELTENCGQVLAVSLQTLENSDIKVDESVSRRRLRECFVVDCEDDTAKCCDICPFRTDRTGLLALHKLRHRAPAVKASKTAQLLFTCPHCPYFVHTSRQLERHVVLHDSCNSTRQEPIVTTTLPAVSERYICEKCPFVSGYRNDFWLHRRMHLGPGSDDAAVKCDSCMFWSSDKRVMLEHAGLHAISYYPRLALQPSTVTISKFANAADDLISYPQLGEDTTRQSLDLCGDEVVTYSEKNFSNSNVPSLSIALENQDEMINRNNVQSFRQETVMKPPSGTRLRGPAAFEACKCALMCPYCHFSIASVHLLRQHVVFHVAVSDANKTPLFNARFDDVDDGLVSEDMCGNVHECDWCSSHLSPTLAEDPVRTVTPLSPPSVDKDEYLLKFELRAKVSIGKL